MEGVGGTQDRSLGLNPILFRLGPIVIHSYSALVSVGLLLGAALVLLSARRRGLDARAVADVALAAAVGGLAVARAAYVGVHWDYYSHHVRLALRPSEGGLLWQGALVGGLMGAVGMGLARRLPLPTLLDVLTPGAASLAAFAWLGCHMVGCAYGIETYPGQGLLWRISLDLPDLYGIREPRVAVQLLGAGWSAALLGVILVVRRRVQRDGIAFGLWLTLHSLSALGLGLLRADEMASVAGWRVDQLANLSLTVVGLLLLVDRAVGGLSAVSHNRP